MPRTSVSMNANGSSSERSTCVSAAKLTIASALGRQRVDERRVADVAVYESVAALSLELGEVGQVAGVGELVEDGDLDLRAVSCAAGARSWSR